MRAAIYARVSTTDKNQDVDVQLQDLIPYAQSRGWDYEVFTDNGSGKSTENRPNFNRMIEECKKKRFDVILVWKLDRFSRSLQNLINTLNDLKALGIDFVSYKENLDFTTPTGRLMINIFAVLAEFERDLTIDRVKAGIQNARAKGKRIGRKPLAPIELKKIIDIYEGNKDTSIRNIARIVGKAKSFVHKVILDYRKGLIDRDGFRCKR